jgi:hypothetical protein
LRIPGQGAALWRVAVIEFSGARVQSEFPSFDLLQSIAACTVVPAPFPPAGSVHFSLQFLQFIYTFQVQIRTDDGSLATHVSSFLRKWRYASRINAGLFRRWFPASIHQVDEAVQSAAIPCRDTGANPRRHGGERDARQFT